MKRLPVEKIFKNSDNTERRLDQKGNKLKLLRFYTSDSLWARNPSYLQHILPSGFSFMKNLPCRLCSIFKVYYIIFTSWPAWDTCLFTVYFCITFFLNFTLWTLHQNKYNVCNWLTCSQLLPINIKGWWNSYTSCLTT